MGGLKSARWGSYGTSPWTMLGPTIVLWLHVDIQCLQMEPQSKFAVRRACFVSVSLTYLSWCNVNVIIYFFFILLVSPNYMISALLLLHWCFQILSLDNDSSTCMGTLEESRKRPEKYVKLYFTLNALSLYLSSWKAKCYFIVHNAFILYVDISNIYSNYHWLSISLFTVTSESDGSPQDSQVLHECFLYLLSFVYSASFIP